MQVIEALLRSLRGASVYNPNVQAPPVCVLWPDADRQWEAIIPRLQNELPELFVLGEYLPEKRIGPAIWLRCVLAGKIPGVWVSDMGMPIFYLPGIGRQDLRAVDGCPDYLKPLAELQFRGAFWSQANGKDWTISAFLKSPQDGFGLDVAQDRDTQNAMQLALRSLLVKDLDFLRGNRLDKDFFNALLTGGDVVRDVLQWLDHPESFRVERGSNKWQAFVEISKSRLGFDPENDGVLEGAARLARHTGPWQAVWDRFCEAPRKYPTIPLQLRKTAIPVDSFADLSGWPQWNEAQENSLRQELLRTKYLSPHEARQQVKNLYDKHGSRRKLVWAELGHAPLAVVMEWLAIVAEATDCSWAGTFDDLVTGYLTIGWQADDAVIRAVACISHQTDLEAVTAAIQSIYLPWADDAARYLQELAERIGYPDGPAGDEHGEATGTGTCFLFADGLRYDLARRLADRLSGRGLIVQENVRWAALPTVTATGKPAVAPVRRFLSGKYANADFEPYVTQTGQELKGGHHFRKLLADSGFQILDRNETGDPTGKAWCEFGDIDDEGHNRGWKLAKRVDELLGELYDRVNHLLRAGWRKISLVTDHGWLFLPGGLPSCNLPSSVTENKWGRCAALKSGAISGARLLPWYWNTEQYFALADGISCYRKGKEYAHGGLSLQECLTLDLNISEGTGSPSTLGGVTISKVVWKRLRCQVTVDGRVKGLFVDLRRQAGNSKSSIVLAVKPLNEDGVASLVVEDEDLQGVAAVVVLLDESGELINQVDVVVGGGEG